MSEQEKLDKRINDCAVLRDCGFDCQSELDRLLTERDNTLKAKENENNENR